MKTITITPADYKKYYLYQYYVNQRFIVKVMRIVGGPILIIMGINFYFGHLYHVAVSLFLIGYGIYYMLRPFIELAIKGPQEESFSYQLENNNLIIQDGVHYTKLNLFDYPLNSNEKYFYLYGENKNVIIFPKEKLDSETNSDFERKVEDLKA